MISLSSSFGGGISRLREVCGCISGMAIVLGLLYGNYDVNDNVQVVNGPLEGFVGTVQEINKEKQKVKVLVSMFGRETPVELEFSQVQKVD